METRVRGECQSLNNLTDFFLTPTNYTFRDFSSAFGNDVAKSIYKTLYNPTYSKKSFKQIFPVNIFTDKVTKKYVFELSDNRQIETVVIKRRTGNTICLSTQVGCPVQCRFCKSGENGLIRNLSTSEIIQQFLFVNEKCAERSFSICVNATVCFNLFFDKLELRFNKTPIYSISK